MDKNTFETKYAASYDSKRGREWRNDFRRNGSVYLLMLPVLLYYFIFAYKPMYGALIAFQNYSPRLGLLNSPWVGLAHFKSFFLSPDFGRILRNTITISVTSLIYGFPMPIILALLLNEIHAQRFKKLIQTISYMPHFISLVVICGMVKSFVSNIGFIGVLAGYFTGTPENLLANAKAFLPIFVISGVWQNIGWDSIIYLAALSSIDMEQYEAADIDGAGRMHKLFFITLPGIAPTIITMLILRSGQIMNVGYEKVILLYNPLIYETSDVISSYVYRLGFETQNWSYSSAVGLFNSIINLILLTFTNYMSKRLGETSLW